MKNQKGGSMAVRSRRAGKFFCRLCPRKTVRRRGASCKRYGEGVFHLGRAAEAGNVYAQYRLGRWYLTEEYKDIRKAVRYLTLAADQNNDLATYRLGKLYLAGEEVFKNTELAMMYLEASACAGNQYAQYMLGKLYLMGKEVEQDREKAQAYFRLAAEQGNEYAAYFWSIGMICLTLTCFLWQPDSCTIWSVSLRMTPPAEEGEAADRALTASWQGS